MKSNAKKTNMASKSATIGSTDPPDIEYPSLLDSPAPVLRAYPKETVVAEKLEALTALGLLNSRMKDFYDLALLSRMYPF